MKPREYRSRRWVLMGLLIAMVGVYIAQLIQIQIVDADIYAALIDRRNISVQTIKAFRGEIVDRNHAPLVTNREGYDIVFDRAFLPYTTQNDIIFRLMNLFEQMQEPWIDNLPISHDRPFSFELGYDDAIAQLKTHLNAQPYATADDVMYWLVERYGLADYALADARKIAGVRYEMERRDFSNRTPYTFAVDIDINTVILIKEHNYELPGVTVSESPIRVIEAGDVAPHAIGTTGPLYKEEYEQLSKAGKIYQPEAEPFDATGYSMDDTIGKDGIERAFESWLRGKNGKREIVTNSSGEALSATEVIAPVPGNTVVLTLDSELQRGAQDYLEAQIRFLQTDGELNARGACAGAVVMLDVKTGEILAMATYPSFNLATFRKDYSSLITQEHSPLVNRATSGLYAPGSIYKPVVGLTGLREGVIDAVSTVICGGIYSFYPDHPFTCLGAHGATTLNYALTVSCNIFFYDVGRRVGIDSIDKTAQQLGLGEPTGIEIAESRGQRSNPATKGALGLGEWYPGDDLQSSIGQLYNLFTPLQLANYAATIANRGTRMELTLVHEIRDYSMQEVIQPFEPKVAEVMDVDPALFDQIFAGMVNASHSASGTARGTFSGYPIQVASKTGTPQTSQADVNSTFICFAPANDPQVAIAVVIEKGWHGYTGAPVAKALLDDYFDIDVRAAVASGPQRLKDQRAAQAAAQESAAADPEAQLPAGTAALPPPEDTPTAAAQADAVPEG